jgi:hypothetical protein
MVSTVAISSDMAGELVTPDKCSLHSKRRLCVHSVLKLIAKLIRY